MDYSLLIAAVPVLAGPAIYIINLGSRLKAHEREDKVTHEYMKLQLSAINIKTSRIEDKLDELRDRL